MDEKKELTKIKFLLDNEIEKKAIELSQLVEQNKQLQSEHEKLIEEEKKIKSDTNIIERAKSNKKLSKLTQDSDSDGLIETNKDIKRLKEEFEESRLLLDSKSTYLRDLKAKHKSAKETLASISKANFTSNRKSNMDTFNALDDKLNMTSLRQVKFSDLIKTIEIEVNKKKDMHQKIQNVEKSIETARNKLLETQAISLTLTQDNEKLNEEYSELYSLRYQLLGSFRSYDDFNERFKAFSLEYDNTVSELRSRLKKNKESFENLEEDVNYLMYFIRFSNSLVRSFFNIINIRRIQIELLTNFDIDFKTLYKGIFSKLNDLEKEFIREYNDFMSAFENDFKYHIDS